MAFSLTSEQQAAVDNRGGGLLVSAAAGSGKTRVLVERLLARVEGEGLDIDRFLVITYTKAAAAELRGRIVEELSARLAERPTDGHLRRQATLVYKAQISTVHAFCAQLLRECGHLLDLDPDFRLCDEGEAGILMLRALNDVLDRRYEDHRRGERLRPAGGHHVRRAGRQPADADRAGHPGPGAGPPRPRRLAGRAGAGLCPGGGGGRGGDPLGPAAAGRRRAAGGATGGAGWPRPWSCARWTRTWTANYAPSLSATLEGLERLCGGDGGGAGTRPAAALPIPFPTAGRKKMVDCPDAAEQVEGHPEHLQKADGEAGGAGSRTPAPTCWTTCGRSTRRCGGCSPW